jgi:hypothetical protein
MLTCNFSCKNACKNQSMLTTKHVSMNLYGIESMEASSPFHAGEHGSDTGVRSIDFWHIFH